MQKKIRYQLVKKTGAMFLFIVILISQFLIRNTEYVLKSATSFIQSRAMTLSYPCFGKRLLFASAAMFRGVFLQTCS